MRYIEPHAHMVSRVTDDYAAMVTAGCRAVCEPAFWAGFDRSSVQGFHDYFCQLTDYEPRRAAMFGLPHYSWLCLNPKEAENLSLAEEVLAMIPSFLDRPNVLGIVDCLKQHQGITPGRVIIDHVEEHTVDLVLDAGFWAGITLYPQSKCTPARAIDMVEIYGSQRLWLNCACDWGQSDPLAVPKTAIEMKRRGHSEEAIDRLIYQNPLRFLSQNPKFRLKEIAWDDQGDASQK
jgi:predicted metal-dependent TIM-barrel fold hydrolase